MMHAFHVLQHAKGNRQTEASICGGDGRQKTPLLLAYKNILIEQSVTPIEQSITLTVTLK